MDYFPQLLSIPLILSILIRALIFIVCFFIGRWLAHLSQNLLRRSLRKTEMPESVHNLAIVGTYYGVLTGFIMLALIILGVPASTVFTILAAIIIILGIALQNSIGNFAATIIFILFKPFETGDIVETNGILGKVREIQMFNTVVVAYDNKVHVLPNSKIQENGVTNYTKSKTLRVDLLFSISYRDDIVKAKSVLKQLLDEDDRVLTEPPPLIYVKQLNDSSVDIEIRPFVPANEYWNFQFDFVERVKIRFDEVGLTIPFPQRDVHFYKESASNN